MLCILNLLDYFQAKFSLIQIFKLFLHPITYMNQCNTDVHIHDTVAFVYDSFELLPKNDSFFQSNRAVSNVSTIRSVGWHPFHHINTSMGSSAEKMLSLESMHMCVH